jgi:hypothetical protein
MGLEKSPFTSYDFWAYLASGFLLLGPADYVFGTNLLTGKDWSWFQIGVAVSSAYVAGHLIAGLSSLVLERGLVGKVLGYPRDILFGQVKVRPWVRWCLAAYYTPLTPETREAALAKGKALGVDGPGEKLFAPAFTAAKDNKKASERMDNFLKLYGFCRNVAVVAFIDAALFGWAYHWRTGEPLHGNLALVCLVVGVGMTFRYLKFFSHFGSEVFTTFAYAKEKTKDEAGKA